MKSKDHIYIPLLALSILILILLTWVIDTSVLTRENEYVGIILLEVIIFAFPCIIFTRLFPQKPENTLKISLFGASKLFLAFVASLLLILGSIFYAFFFSGVTDGDSTFTLYNVFTAKRSDLVSDNIYLVLIYALLPAVFEEFTFRGVICSGYEKSSTIYSIIMSSLFFGMIHFDLTMLPFYIFAGAVLGIVLYASGSIFVPIIVHFAFNLFFIFASDYVNAFVSANRSFAFFVIGILFFVLAFLFCGECKSIYKKKALNAPLDENRSAAKAKVNLIEVLLSPTAVVCYLLYFAVEFLK